MKPARRFSMPRGRSRNGFNVLAGSSLVVAFALLIGCAQPEAYNRVARPARPESLESTGPTRVEELSKNATLAGGDRPHVLLISLDTLRADHLGAWGYDRPTSPFLDELARFGVHFDRAFSHSPTTAPSHMSVFTGAFPSDHGEELLDHNGLLHKKLYQETLRVPLIFFWPPRVPKGVVVEAQVPLMDLTPTLFELTGIKSPPQTNARSLLPLFAGAGRAASRLVYSESPWAYRKPHQRCADSYGHLVRTA